MPNDGSIPLIINNSKVKGGQQMLRSMYAGISGLKSHQTRMDVIGNNIANINTAGYKKSRVVFKDTLYQNLQPANSPVQGQRGGINPMGVGLGVSVASIDQIHTPSPATSTNKMTDVAIDGNGYFILINGGTTMENATDVFYTRAGAFDFETDGTLVSTANGYQVVGWMADPDNDWDMKSTLSNINIADLKELEGRSTTEANLRGNLDAEIKYRVAKREVQVLSFSTPPISTNTFTLTSGAVTTGDITVGGTEHVTATRIEAALTAVLGPDAVKVVWNGTNYEIEFQQYEDVPEMVFTPGTATGGVISTKTQGVEPLQVSPNEMQILDLSTATGGQYQLIIPEIPEIGMAGSVTTALLDYNADAATIKQAIIDAVPTSADYPSLADNISVKESKITKGLFAIEFINQLSMTDIDPPISWANSATPITGNPAPAPGNLITVNNGINKVEFPRDSVIISQEVYDSEGMAETVYFRFFKYEVHEPVPETRWACDISLNPLFEQAPDFHPLTDFSTSDLTFENVEGSLVSQVNPKENKGIFRVTNLLFNDQGEIMYPLDPNNPEKEYTAGLVLEIDRSKLGAGASNLGDTTKPPEPIKMDIDLSKLSQYAKSSEVIARQDGYRAGNLTSYNIDTNGYINGVYDNGQIKQLAQIALRNFENPGGLNQVGGTLFKESVNSGALKPGQPASGGRGKIAPSSLEMSNVDLSEEFTDMIVTQRGFQANSRIITTSDEMLQELVNLKR
jgi:flagellar hook protein FlgE